MANILVLGVKVPFTKGGQDVLVHTLVDELKRRGHTVDSVELPLSMDSKESLLKQAAMWRTMDFSSFGGKETDLIITTKFPSYFAQHKRKSVWLVHQHRPMYELFGGRYSDFSDDPRDEALRRMLFDADNKVIGECQYVSGISKNVIQRLEEYNQIKGEVLYPPLAQAPYYRSEEGQDYILAVGRICYIKRLDLMIKALPMVHNFVKLKVVGTPDEPGVKEYLENEIDKHHLWDRVEFLGRVGDEELRDLYARALAVYFAPHDEDYGYVTLEGMASGRPILTANDSGGVLEFVEHEKTGLIVEPTIDGMGHGANRLIEDREFAAQLGANGRKKLEEIGLASGSWDTVVDGLLFPLEAQEKGELDKAV